jgi:hypothetical protein
MMAPSAVKRGENSMAEDRMTPVPPEASDARPAGPPMTPEELREESARRRRAMKLPPVPTRAADLGPSILQFEELREEDGVLRPVR